MKNKDTLWHQNKLSYLKLWYRWFKSDLKKTYYRDCEISK
jgi:hypothetical protein